MASKLRPKPHRDVQDVTVLLIGSCGNGKSTLGNYLLSPKRGEKYFATATDNLPETQFCQSVSKIVRVNREEHEENVHEDDDLSFTEVDQIGTPGLDEVATREINLTVIDTPGLNESKERDLHHMINLIEKLQKEKCIHICIFVVKFRSKIDQQYKDTIKYYARLLPALFENNVLIVMTDYATDERSKAVREMEGINSEAIMSNVIKEIVRGAKISFTPMLFAIDCLPYLHIEVTESEKVRMVILSYIMSRNAVKMEDLQVAKTKALMEEDSTRIASLDGEITGYNLRLQEANKSAEKALKETQEREKHISVLDSELVNLKRELAEKDNADLVTSNTWSVDDNSWYFWWKDAKLDIDSQWEIEKIEKWTNGSCRFTNLLVEEKRVRGELDGDFNSRLYASLKVMTTKRLKYAGEISQLQHTVAIKQSDLKSAMEAAHMHKLRYEEFKNEIDLLHKFIINKRDEIKKLSSDVMSISDAHSRLSKIESTIQ